MSLATLTRWNVHARDNYQPCAGHRQPQHSRPERRQRWDSPIFLPSLSSTNVLPNIPQLLLLLARNRIIELYGLPKLRIGGRACCVVYPPTRYSIHIHNILKQQQQSRELCLQHLTEAFSKASSQLYSFSLEA